MHGVHRAMQRVIGRGEGHQGHGQGEYHHQRPLAVEPCQVNRQGSPQQPRRARRQQRRERPEQALSRLATARAEAARDDQPSALENGAGDAPERQHAQLHAPPHQHDHGPRQNQGREGAVTRTCVQRRQLLDVDVL